MQWISQSVYGSTPIESLHSIAGIILTIMTLVGLYVFWTMLSSPAIVTGRCSTRRRLLELFLYYIVLPVYVPVITAVAGLKTSTAYALGKRPTGHYVPTPK